MGCSGGDDDVLPQEVKFKRSPSKEGEGGECEILKVLSGGVGGEKNFFIA